MLNSVLKIFCFLALFLLEVFAQHNGEIIWNKTYGGDSYDEADAVMATYDSAYIVGGYTQSFGLGRFGNAYMVKTNLTGDTIWTRMYGRDGMDVFTSVVVDPDSNYLAVGFTDTQNDYENIYAVKVNEEGSTIWEKNYGGTQKDIGHSIVKASDGGFIIAGETKSFGNGDADVFLMKINNNGDSLWFKTYGTLGNDAAYGINSTDDGGYIVTGLYNSADLWLLRINSAGDTLWTKSIGGTDYEEGINSVETSDKGFITCGSTASIRCRATGCIFSKN